LELAVIRWIAVEVRIFAYIKNLTLLVCFLGFGLGCALARSGRVRWLTAANALLGLLIIVRWPWRGGRVPEGLKLPDGEFVAANLFVNHVGYQYIVNLSPDFLARHPHVLGEPNEENHFNLPFRFVKVAPSVLIVGAGAGNDAAAALRNGSRFVDAVEIDPAILALGKKQHPERPYDWPQVAVHLTDARNFLKRSQNRYDLILFGALDSHTEFSDYSNMRLDNFVYTLESFREAREHLAPDGVLYLIPNFRKAPADVPNETGGREERGQISFSSARSLSPIHGRLT
jgi:SAM-dependent methyltransferase